MGSATIRAEVRQAGRWGMLWWIATAVCLAAATGVGTHQFVTNEPIVVGGATVAGAGLGAFIGYYIAQSTVRSLVRHDADTVLRAHGF